MEAGSVVCCVVSGLGVYLSVALVVCVGWVVCLEVGVYLIVVCFVGLGLGVFWFV